MCQTRSGRTVLLMVVLLSAAAVGAISPARPPTGQTDAQPAADSLQTRIDSLRALIDGNDYAAARSLARDLLARVESQASPQTLPEAAILDLYVEALWRGGREFEPETLELAKRALLIREQRLGPHDPLVADSLVQKSNVLQRRSEYSSGMALLLQEDAHAAIEAPLLRALDIYRESLGPKDPKVASVYQCLADLLRKSDRLDEAQDYIEKAIGLYIVNGGTQSLDVAAALSVSARIAHQLGELDEAESLYRRALSIREELLGLNHPRVAISLSELGQLKWRADEYEAAKQLWQRALDVREEDLGADDPAVADSLIDLGIIGIFLGEPEDAGVALRRAIEIHERVAHPHLARGLAMYAILANSTDDPVLAVQLNERALEILETNEGPAHPHFGLTLSYLGDVHYRLGDYDKARSHLERSVAVLEKSLGPGMRVSDVLERLVSLEIESGRLEAARRLAERNLVMRGDDDCGPLETLGHVLQLSGDVAQARILYERALALRERAFGREHTLLLKSLLPLADLRADSGDCTGALPLYRRALAIRVKMHGPDHSAVGVVHLKVAECLATLGAKAEAFDTALRAEDNSRKHLRWSLTGLAERAGLQYAATRVSGLDLAFSLLIEDPSSGSVEKAFDALIRSRALILDEMAERRRVVSDGADPDLHPLVERLAAARNRLATITVQGPSEQSEPGDYLLSLNRARADRDKAERDLAEKSRAFRIRQARTNAGLLDIKAALPPGSGLVGFARIERLNFNRANAGKADADQRLPTYLALVQVQQAEAPVLVPLGSAEEIDELVGRLQRHMYQQSEAPDWVERQALAAYRQDADLLRRRIWDPIQPHLDVAERIFIVPDGFLHLVNLAALPIGELEYLIEHGPQIHYLSAERDLVAPSSVSIGTGLLALGNPDFDERGLFTALVPDAEESRVARLKGPGDTGRPIYRGRRSSCDSIQTMKFEPLDATEREVHDVIALWSRGRQTRQQGASDTMRQGIAHLNGENANETAFKLMAPGRRNLHLATHGFFLGGRCPAPVPVESPLLRTGLVMAGANHRQAAGPDEDDGILTAEEIAALDLGGVEWAVLSACESGLGDVRAGEGVFGLRRAFSIAGARTLIMSLWRVEDEPTRDWMRLLYERRYVDGLETAEAVHRASLELLQQRRRAGQSTHPFYWAGFVAAGNWR